MATTISWPFGDADQQTPAAAAPLAVTITEQLTILQPGTMGADMTINLTIDPAVRAGAFLMVTAKSDGAARLVTPGTGFTSGTIAGVINKTKNGLFMYDGVTFKPVAAPVQID